MKRDDKTRAAAVSSGPIYGGDFDFDTIRMIALDLDGTTLTRNGLTRRTKETLEEAIRRGIHVVIATGRVFRMRRPGRFFTPTAWSRRR